MTARSPGAFMLSATFHALVIGLILFFGLMLSQEQKTTPHVLELVAGEGDNYGATVAPALGTPNGIKLDLTATPLPKAEPTPAPTPAPEPTPIEAAPPPPSPVTPVKPPPPTPKPVAAPKPTPAPTTAKPAPTIPNFAREIRRKQWAAEWRAKRDLAREHAEEQKRLKQEELDRQRAKAAAAKTASSRVSHIDAEGIAKGVLGGSTDNKVGGAGGKALTSSGGALTDRYFAMLKQRVLNALEKPPGVSDDLTVTIVVHIWPDGRLTGAHVVKSSGSSEFDRAVISAFGNVQMPEHPEHKSEDLELSFRTRDAGQG